MGIRSEQRWVRRCLEQHQTTTDKMRQAEALRMPRRPRAPVAPLPSLPSRREVKAWMLRNASDCDEGATMLAQSAAAALDLPESWLDDETHWLWDVAFEVWELVQ